MNVAYFIQFKENSTFTLYFKTKIIIILLRCVILVAKSTSDSINNSIKDKQKSTAVSKNNGMITDCCEFYIKPPLTKKYLPQKIILPEH